MTADEFERQYAERSGTTVERLRELGRIVAPCDCGEDICEGWQSTTVERLLDAVYCVFCGVPLFGGATVHKPDCEIRKLIAEHFPSLGSHEPAPRPPGYWMHESSGRLAEAMKRYLKEEPLSNYDVGLIRAYLVQWIESPVWDENPNLDAAGRQELEELRQAAHKIASRRAIDEWVEVAADWGMDPL